MKSIRYYVTNKYAIGGAILVAILVVFFIRREGTQTGIESAQVKFGNIVEKVSVTGKVEPVEKADLAFSKSGILTYIYPKVGDYVKKGSIIASLNNATIEASLAGAVASLNEEERSLRPEELMLEEAKLDGARTAFENAKRDVLNASRIGYTKAQTAITNYVDSFFNNPQSAYPVINIPTQSLIIKDSINLKRLIISEKLSAWKIDLSKEVATTTNDFLGLISRNQNYLNIFKDFLTDFVSIINYLNSGNTGLTQSAIDSYVSAINSALAGINDASTSFTAAESSFKNAVSDYDEANNQFILRKVGSSAESINAKASSVSFYIAELNQGRISSPFDGLVTKIIPNVGEFVSAGETVLGVISGETFKIEAYVPEADIAKVKIGNRASVTLDAYGSDVVFTATVMTIDPAETILENVPTYKVTLQFDQKDDRVRSGMTANIDILTNERNNVLIIPFRAVIDSDGKKSVRVLESNGKKYTTVSINLGLKGSDGNIEVVNGLKVGQKVVTFIK